MREEVISSGGTVDPTPAARYGFLPQTSVRALNFSQIRVSFWFNFKIYVTSVFNFLE